jgi:hypothetical protein
MIAPKTHRPLGHWQMTANWLPLLLAALFCACLQPVQADPLRDPKRVVNGATVNLTPLFHWWTNHQGSRPLTAWVHAHGTISGTNALGWIISGKADKSSLRSGEQSHAAAETKDGPKFILKNPPLQDVAAFESLRQQLSQANADRARVQQDETNAKTKETTVRKTTRGRNRNQATAQLRNEEQADKSQLQTLDAQIHELKKKLAVYPNPDHYQVDAIVLDTGTDSGALPVYDHGYAIK